MCHVVRRNSDLSSLITVGTAPAARTHTPPEGGYEEWMWGDLVNTAGRTPILVRAIAVGGMHASHHELRNP